jgi:hypothetical protein
VGALKAQMAEMDRHAERLMAAGLLPRNLRGEIEVRQVVDKIMAVFREHGVPDDTKRALQAALGGQNGRA